MDTAPAPSLAAGAIVAWVVLAYVVGSIPSGLLVGRLRGVDIRTVGSGNIGATNVYRTLGRAWGIATFVADALKGFVPAFVFPLLAGGRPGGLGLACGMAAVVGHSFSVFLGLRGGKGVATSAGMLLGVAPAAAGIGFAVWAGLFLATRYVSVGSIGAAAAIPASGWILYRKEGWVLPATLTVLGLLIVVKHRTNIRRLLTGQEHRFGARPAAAPAGLAAEKPHEEENRE